jgi:hypothetical protein
MASTPTQRKNGRQQHLVRHLTERFLSEAECPHPPLVILNRIPQTRTVHLLVIWDEWQSLSIPERSRIITDAYVAAYPDETATVTIPLGLTASEALSMGYLPYEIVPSIREGKPTSRQALAKAMRSVGGIYVQVGAQPQLRFATHPQAEEAYRKLVKLLPNQIWTLIQERTVSETA